MCSVIGTQVSVRSNSRGCLPTILKYVLEKHSAYYQVVPDSVCSPSFSGVWGWFRNTGPTDISQSHEVKTLFWVLEHRQWPRTEELKTNLIHCVKLSATNHTVLLGRSKNYLAFYLFKRKRFPNVSNMLSFFKAIQKGLSTVVYENRAGS